MFIKQVSVFLENKDGRLEKVTEIIKDHKINILSITLSEKTEYGVLRMIVSDPEKAKDVLKEENYSAKLVDVIGVKVSHKVGRLHEMLKVLSSKGVGISYMYLLDSGKKPSMIIKTFDNKKALSILKEDHYEVLTEEVYSLYC